MRQQGAWKTRLARSLAVVSGLALAVGWPSIGCIESKYFVPDNGAGSVAETTSSSSGGLGGEGGGGRGPSTSVASSTGGADCGSDAPIVRTLFRGTGGDVLCATKPNGEL